jgi:hypothetical protein
MMPALVPVVRPLLGVAGAGAGDVMGVEVELLGQQPLWQPKGPTRQLGYVSLSLLEGIGAY